jgi:HAMP domain-containing protein
MFLAVIAPATARVYMAWLAVGLLLAGALVLFIWAKVERWKHFRDVTR